MVAGRNANATQVRTAAHVLADIVVAEDKNGANRLVGERAQRDAGGVFEWCAWDVLAGQEPDLDSPRKPERADEVGQLGAF